MRSVHDIYNQLSIKTKRALEKHKLTKRRKQERKKQVMLQCSSSQTNRTIGFPPDIVCTSFQLISTIHDNKLIYMYLLFAMS